MGPLNIIKNILDVTGPRPSCSESEKKAAELIAGELKACCDSVRIEKFFAHPGENLFWMKVSSVLIFFSAAAFFYSPLLSFAFFILSSLNFIVNGILAIRVYEHLFQKKGSQNVIGIKNPKGKAKKTIIFSAHHDSGFISPLFKNSVFGMSLIKAGIIFSGIGAIAVISNLFISYLNFKIPFLQPLFFFLFLVYFLLIFYITLFIRHPSRFSPGANDNLSAVSLILNIAKKSKKMDGTRLMFISFGCEEISAVGSQEYVKKHYSELKDAVCINFDAIGCIGKFAFMDIERIGFSRYDEGLKKEFKQLIQKHKGSVAEGKIRLFGITDGGSFANKGIRTISIIGVDENKLIPYWHQESDTADKIEIKTIEILTNVCLDYLMKVDKWKK
jgi:hypothetical protein